MRFLTFDSKEEWAFFHEEFLAALPLALERFRHRAARHGLTTDGTVESLGPIGDWFAREIRHPESAPGVPLPPWWKTVRPWAGTGTPDDGPFTPDHVILMDEMQSYLADVLVRVYPNAKWVIFRGERRELRRGSTLLQLGDRNWPAQTVTIVHMAALKAVLRNELPPSSWLQLCAIEELNR